MKRIAVCSVAVCLAVAAFAADGPFIAGIVPSEHGFEGAVTVVSESVDDNFGVVMV